MLINNSFKIKNLQISQKTWVKLANLPQPIEISTKSSQNPLFTAAQAAQKALLFLPLPMQKFTAAQAAQKISTGDTVFGKGFTAAQAAQKFCQSVQVIQVSFTAAQAAQKYTNI